MSRLQAGERRHSTKKISSLGARWFSPFEEQPSGPTKREDASAPHTSPTVWHPTAHPSSLTPIRISRERPCGKRRGRKERAAEGVPLFHSRRSMTRYCLGRVVFPTHAGTRGQESQELILRACVEGVW